MLLNKQRLLALPELLFGPWLVNIDTSTVSISYTPYKAPSIPADSL